jgi:hypothetical protein
MYNNNYYLDCTCTVKACSHRGTEVTLWETVTERKVYCTVCKNTRIVRKRIVCSKPKVKVCNRYLVNNDVYVVFL